MVSIGMLDSGVGGLTILKTAMETLPDTDFYFIGDNQRAPYGSRSQEEIKCFSKQMVERLLEKEIDILVLACNTISAIYLEELQADLDIPVIGVIEAAAKKALDVSKTNHIAVIGTETTINSNVYKKTLESLNEKKLSQQPIHIYQKATQKFVELVENNQMGQDATQEIVNQELADLMKEEIDTLLLGCTHFPFLKSEIKQAVGDKVSLVDASTLLPQLLQILVHRLEASKQMINRKRRVDIFTTGSVDQFESIARQWLTDESINISSIELKGVMKNNE